MNTKARKGRGGLPLPRPRLAVASSSAAASAEIKTEPTKTDLKIEKDVETLKEENIQVLSDENSQAPQGPSSQSVPVDVEQLACAKDDASEPVETLEITPTPSHSTKDPLDSSFESSSNLQIDDHVYYDRLNKFKAEIATRVKQRVLAIKPSDEGDRRTSRFKFDKVPHDLEKSKLLIHIVLLLTYVYYLPVFKKIFIRLHHRSSIFSLLLVT